MHLFGYAASLFIGISLGIIGGGGSILTVPVLVYLFGVEPVLATAYSLFIVGATSLVGSFSKFQSKEIHLKTAVIFGLPSIAAVYATRAYLLPAVPDPVFHLAHLEVSKGLLLLLLFAVLMLFASLSMIRSGAEQVKQETQSQSIRYNYPLIVLEGITVGTLTGFVGAGGGFLIIPALVLFSKLPMKIAVGTSLLIIAAKSLIGFTGDLGKQAIEWNLLLAVTALAITGVLVGNVLSRKITAAKLKQGFGWFVLAMGAYILVKEIVELWHLGK